MQPSPPAALRLGFLLLGGLVAFERMTVRGVVLASVVEVRLARRNVTESARLPLRFRILRLGVRRYDARPQQTGSQNPCGNRAL